MTDGIQNMPRIVALLLFFLFFSFSVHGSCAACTTIDQAFSIALRLL